MRVQHNIPAMNAYRNYNNNSSGINKNLEKLSSGYKINRAGDDAAGLAISEKMRAQITGLEVAQNNAKNGISLVQTAEGALTEVQDMLNRMYKLAEQSANGTYDEDIDRNQLDKEVQKLRDEIDRIANTANFNGTNLLDGKLAASGNGTINNNGNQTPAAGYDYSATGAASNVAATDDNQGADNTGAAISSISISLDDATADHSALNNIVFSLSYGADNDGDGTGDSAITDATGAYTLTDNTGNGYDFGQGGNFSFDINDANGKIGTMTFSISGFTDGDMDGSAATLSADITVTATDANANNNNNGNTNNNGNANGTSGATFTPGTATTAMGANQNINTVTVGNGLVLWIGAEAKESNALTVEIDSIKSDDLAITSATVDISTQEKALNSLQYIEAAINKVSDIRGTLGATQNRLEHTINNLSVMQENMQDAESTIRDTDVAEEMMKYTKNSILVQSAQAMLAQANQLPQGVLQLLQ